MDEQLARTIIEEAPTLYGQSGPVYSLEIDDGWFHLVLDLTRRLEAINARRIAADESPMVLLRVKEKFGALLVACQGTANGAEAAIHSAEVRSVTICERCGDPGTLHRNHGWHRTLCDPHNRDYLRTKFPYQAEVQPGSVGSLRARSRFELPKE